MASAVKSQDYQLVEDVKADGEIVIKEHKNNITGIRIFTATVECPIVKGNLVIATEAHDDDGLPHTLEHLVFMGSEDYPYKGVLDLLANRCLASGTNAYTDTDHTSYSMATAGSDGFLNLLPVYLDHLLFPTLKDSAYMTEVHHINGEGEDAGVVYCEMQARENTGDSRCYLEMLRSLYPDCGYKSETGGLMKNLRTSTNNVKVKNYHRKFYKPQNLAIVITGPVEPDQVFKAIKPIEDKIVLKGLHNEPFERPWMKPVTPLPSCVTKTIEYSCDTEDDGLVYLGYRGPTVEEGYLELVAVSVLLEYLNNTPISPVQQAFVECSEPFCSSVSHNIIESSTSCFYFSFESVGQEYLDKCLGKLNALLNKYATEEEKLDMERMSTIISRKILNILSSAETSPHSFVVNPVTGHFLYGHSNFKQRCQEIESLRQFSAKDSKFWLDLLRKYMVSPDTARYVCVVGKPSRKLMESMSNEEKKRIEEQQNKLKDELPDIAARLKEAINLNEKPPPQEMLRQVPVPTTENIKFHKIERVVVEDCVNYRFHYDSIKTNFVTIQMLFNSSEGLTHEDRLFLPLLSECILESPINDGNIQLSYEDFMAKLFAETVSYGSAIGLASGSPFSAGPISMLFNISMQVEVSKYDTAIDLYRQILYHTQFTPERVTTIATRMFSDISQYKRSGGKVTSAGLACITYIPNSNQWAANFLRQQTFLKKLLKTMKEQPDLITERLRKIRDCLCEPKNVILHITLDKDKMDAESCYKPWDAIASQRLALSGQGVKKLDIFNVVPCKALIDPSLENQAIIIGVGSVESNFMQQSVRSIDSPMHPDLPALYVLIQYLTQLEGPLWRQVRGMGLSYHYSIQISPSDGLLYMLLYKSTQVVEAYKEMKKIVYRFLEKQEEFEDSLFESAKSSLIFEFIKREKSAAGRSMQSLIAYLKNLDIDFNQQLINKVANVTKDELSRIGPKYLKDLFESHGRRTVVCCNPSKIRPVTEGLLKLDLKLQQISLEGDSILNTIEPLTS